MPDWSDPGLRLAGGWLYAVLVPAAALLAYLVYRVTQPPVNRSRRLLLTGLRTGALFMLLMSLAEPVLSLHRRLVVRPTLTVLLDTSSSMAVQETEGTRLAQILGIVTKAEWRQALSAFKVEMSVFGQQVTPVEPDTVARLRAEGEATDLGRAIQGEPGQRPKSAQPGAILLISDGGHNLGYDPVRAAAEVGVPVYCLSLGAVTGPSDAAIAAVRIDGDEGHVGRPLVVEAFVRSSGRPGVPAKVRLFVEGVQVATEELTLPADGTDLPVRLVWRPAHSGSHQLRVALEPPSDEVWRENDEARLLVRVREQRARVLVVAGGPGPELSFLRRSLAVDSSLTMTTRVYRGNGAFYEAPGAPVVSLADQDAVILVDPALEVLKGSMGLEVVTRVRGGCGLLFIGGPRSAAYWGTAHPLAEVLPVIQQPGFVATGVPLKLAAEGANHPLGRLMQGSGEGDAWVSLPPLPGYLATSGLRPGAVRLVEGAGGARPPVLVAGGYGLGRVVVGLSTSFWRLDLMSTGVNGRPQTIREFWRAALRWLALESPGGRVRVATEHLVYRAGEAVGFTAQVLDEFMQPEDTASVAVTLSPAGGTRLLQAQGGGRYRGEWPGLGPGDYAFTAEAAMGSTAIGADQGRFIVEERTVESTDLRANPGLLARVARAGGGEAKPLREWRQLVAALPLHPRLESHAVDLSWWPSAWAVTVVLVLLSVEWLLRRRWGQI
jgi:hypothetical protein